MLKIKIQSEVQVAQMLNPNSVRVPVSCDDLSQVLRIVQHSASLFVNLQSVCRRRLQRWRVFQE